jgi:hypothetical protein
MAVAAVAVTLDSTFTRGCEAGERHLEVRVGNVETETGGRQVFGAVAKTARSDEGRARRDLPKHLRNLHESEDLRLALRKVGLPQDLDRRQARPTQRLAA